MAGRPRIQISAEQVFKLASRGCKNTEIAEFFGVSDDTIHRNFAAEVEAGRAEVKYKLRDLQMKVAEEGNVQMLVWLGKQILNQSDRVEIELTKVDDATFAIEAERRLNAGQSGNS